MAGVVISSTKLKKKYFTKATDQNLINWSAAEFCSVAFRVNELQRRNIKGVILNVIIKAPKTPCCFSTFHLSIEQSLGSLQ